MQRECQLTFTFENDNKVAVQLNTKMGDTAKAVRTELATAI